jgi:hypothetical protein
VLEREKDRDILQSTVVVLISYGTKKKKHQRKGEFTIVVLISYG